MHNIEVGGWLHPACLPANMEPGPGVSPGGPRISSAKKRRLAALEQNLGASGAGSSVAAAAGQADSSLPRSSSSASFGQARSSGGGKRRAGGANGSGTSVGRSASSGCTTGEAQPPAGPPYDRLDVAIAVGPAAEALQLPRPEPHSQVISSLLEQLMATNPRAFDARAAIGLKVQDRTVMLDNPVGQQQAQQGQQGGSKRRGGGVGAGRQSRWTAKLAGRKQQRALGLYQLKGEGLTYEAVQPLHHSWRQYMQELLAPGVTDVEARLYAADLHGCLIRVAHTADRRYEGLQGIIVRDTTNTLHLVTPDSRFVVVPKQLCTWEFDADRRRVVTLLGPGLVQRGIGIGGSGDSGAAGRPKTLREAIRGQAR